ncbi:general substrate transporter [Mycena crocata]|nr:general substrate transporter [Mycena crocata]
MSSLPRSQSAEMLAISRDIKPILTHNGSLKTIDESTAPTFEAQSLSPTSWASLKLYRILLVPTMASVCVGYDASVMSYINGMETYLTYFGLDGKGIGVGVGTQTALIFGMYTMGSCFAVLLSGPVSDRFGRRGGMAAGGFFCIIGGIVVTVAQDVRYLKGGRFLLGVSTALLAVAMPMYIVEMSPPQWRGRLTGIFAAIAIFGTIISGIVTTMTGQLTTSASWRIPLSLQIIPAAAVLCCSYLIPESPRWLLSVGRKDEARMILIKYHGNGDDSAPLVILEFEEFEEAIKVDASRKPWWDYAALFRTRSSRYRMFTILLMSFCSHWSGSGLSHFLMVLLANDHVDTQNLRFILSLVSSIIAVIGGVSGALISDKVGRRTHWFCGTVCFTTALIISGVCTALWGSGGYNQAGSNAAIAFLFLFNFFFCATYLPLAAYPSECLGFENRANGIALHSLVGSLASLVNTMVTPIALATIQWRLYCVFIAWDLVACILIWLFAVETSGRTLEELNEIFEDPNPVKASRKPYSRSSTVLNLVPVGESKETVI